MTLNRAFSPGSLVRLLLPVFFVVMGYFSSALAMRTEFIPFIHVSEDYTDNYDHTAKDKEEEFYTTYGVGFSFSMLDKTKKVELTYSPEFVKYDTHDERDTWEHNASLTGDLNFSRRGGVNFDLSYDGNGDSENRKYESWEHSASLAGHYDLAKHTGMTFSEDYARTFDRTQRTGEWEEHETNTTSMGITHEFGRDNSLGFTYSYAFDNYDDPDQDEYEKHSPSLFLGFWFTPLFGFDSNLSYEKEKYDLSENEPETWNGDFRLIKKLTRHFQVYLKYEHTYTKEEVRDHIVYNPSLGFDWEITKDSGVSLGAGYLFNEWEDQDNDGKVFFDVDAYRNWDFSKRGSLVLTAASGYDASDEEAASLGYNIYYQAGCLLTYQLARRLSTDFTGSYSLDQFDDPDVDRVDKTLTLGTGLTWTPLRSLSLNAYYSFSDFATDADPGIDYRENSVGAGFSWTPVRWMRVSMNYSYTDYNAENDEDYQENMGTLTVHISPARPALVEFERTRKDIENRIYNGK